MVRATNATANLYFVRNYANHINYAIHPYTPITAMIASTASAIKDTANNSTNSLFCGNFSSAPSCWATPAMMSAPVVDIGVNPDTVPPITITDTNSTAPTPSPDARPLAVGISVGNTTPRPELKNDIKPAVIAMIIAAVRCPMIFSDLRP